MDKYHIGTRARGFAKNFFKSLHDKTQKKYVPHITLIRPFTTENEEGLINIFKKTIEEFTKRTGLISSPNGFIELN
jgi:2'-5' RNA ligase